MGKNITRKEAIQIVDRLKETYPEAKCSLDFATPFELVVATVLSAQCTDERVNKTTPSIFAEFNTPELFAKADIKRLEELIHPCGFYKTKSKNIQAMARKLVEEYKSEVPQSMEELMKLPGVGRKTANVVMLEAFDDPQGIAVDTHCKRLANRVGLSKEVEPSKIEEDLLRLLPKEYYKDVNHIFIWHGRNSCTARNPKCEQCPISNLCEFAKKGKRNKK